MVEVGGRYMLLTLAPPLTKYVIPRDVQPCAKPEPESLVCSGRDTDLQMRAMSTFNPQRNSESWAGTIST